MDLSGIKERVFPFLNLNGRRILVSLVYLFYFIFFASQLFCSLISTLLYVQDQCTLNAAFADFSPHLLFNTLAAIANEIAT